MLCSFSHHVRSSRLLIASLLAIAGFVLMGIEGLTSSNPPALISIADAQSSVKTRRERAALASSATGAWSIAASLNTPRGLHTATLLPNGKVLVAGGLGDGGDLATAELYDPAANTWSFTGSLVSARNSHTATLLANGKVLITGGEQNGQLLQTAELYDPIAGTWSSAADFNSRRSNHTATLLQNGKVLIDGGNGFGGSLSGVELYDPTSNTWSAAASLGTGREAHAATRLQDGRVMVVGGFGPGSTLAAGAELYNPATNSWSNTGSLITPRAFHTANLLGNGKVLVAGGESFSSGLTSAELYDPVTNAWSSIDPLSAVHVFHEATLLQDGSLLVVGGDTNDNGSALSESYDPTTGGWSEPRALSADRKTHTLTLLPNGKVLAVGGFGKPVSSTSPPNIITTNELYDPAATGPAGTPRIVFGSIRHQGNHDIYSMELDGTLQTRLTTSPAYDDQPKWSPDGTKIVFMSDRDGNFEIYTMNADGSTQTRVTSNFAADGFPAWSHDGTRIAFVRGDLRNPSTFEIFVMNADGSNQIRLTNDSVIDGVPSWSPDNTKIVFMSGGSSVFDPNAFEIFAMNADGSSRTRLTNNSIVDGQPSYSPDGSRILFASGNAMNPNGIEIFVMNADGSNRVQLTTNNVTDGFPAWSFDGSNIIFASGSIAGEATVELFVMNSNGTNQSKLTNNSELDWFPDWQPVQTPPSQIQFTSPNYEVNEGSGGYFIIVNRSGNTTGMAAVDYTTSDTAGANNCSVVSNVASSRCDYETTLGTLNFAPGETSKIITVFRIDDSYAESSEDFSVILSNAVGSGVALGSPATATVTIIDNDSVTGPNPIDQAGFFVLQHYLDFLNREPDAAGFDFWSNQITSCGSDAQCIEIRRINVSAAFFLSIEFQETGYLVYRMYKVAHNPPGIPVPVRYAEFISDTRQIGQDVVIGQPGAEQKLESNKQAFALNFVLRLRFIQDHPTSRTPAELVDALYANAGVTPSAAERMSAINEFGGAPNTVDTAARARVLRRVAENSTLRQQEFNKAFVLMQYFGYLRRNPFDPPESTLNFDGYNFWLNKLNQFNGNFVEAEMVKAFIISGEYRQRFGP
jgi:Tol biopolymer transport system component